MKKDEERRCRPDLLLLILVCRYFYNLLESAFSYVILFYSNSMSCGFRARADLDIKIDIWQSFKFLNKAF